MDTTSLTPQQLREYHRILASLKPESVLLLPRSREQALFELLRAGWKPEPVDKSVDN